MPFQYTKEAINVILQTAKKTIFWIACFTQTLTIIYLIYTLIAATGNPVINSTLLVISVCAFIYSLYTELSDGKQKNENTIKHVLSVSKLLIKLFNLGIIIYGFYTAASTVSAISIIITVFMILFWIIQIIIEILTILIVYIKYFVLEAVDADLNSLKRPFNSTGNFFRRLVGKEVKPTSQPSSVQQKLQKRIQQKKEQRKQDKIQAKADKKQQRVANKQAKKNANDVSSSVAVTKK